MAALKIEQLLRVVQRWIAQDQRASVFEKILSHIGSPVLF